MTTGNYDKRRLIEWLRAETARPQIDFDALDVASLRELVRLIRDLDHEAGGGEPGAHDAVAALKRRSLHARRSGLLRAPST